MNHSHSRRARLRVALAAVIAAAAFPAAASAAEITAFKAGPVAPFNNGAGLPFVPNQSPPPPQFAPSPPFPPGTPNPVDAPSVVPGSADTNCAYGKVQPGKFVAEANPTWNGQGARPTPGTTSQNALPVYSTAAADEPLELATQANAYTDYCIAFRNNSAGHPDPGTGGERVKNNIVTLPVGVVAGIDNQVKCSEAEFNRHSDDFAPNTCPVSSQVGTATVRLRVPSTSDSPLTPGFVATRDSPGRVYALDTPANLAARFGVALMGGSRAVPVGGTTYAIPDRHTKFQIDVSQQGVATVGLINQTDELAQVVPNAGGSPDAHGNRVVPIQFAGGAFRFWGKASDHPFADPQKGAAGRMAADFLRMPSTCARDLVAHLTVTPYGADAVASPADKIIAADAKVATATSNAVRLTGCEQLPFNPSFSAKLTGETGPGDHPGLDFAIDVPEGNDDLAATRITLPDGVASDLENIKNACLPADFTAINCGPATIIGSVTATISGFNPDVVKGDIHMVRIEGQTLPALGFNFKGRLPLRLSGLTQIDSNGRIVNTFVDLPSIPQRSLRVSLAGGPKSILRMSTGTCSVSAFEAQLTSQNGRSVAIKQRTRCDAEFKAILKRADTSRPYLNFNGAGATGKKIKSLRLTMPPGLTVRRGNTNKRTKVSALEETVTKNTSRRRINKKLLRVSIPQTGSNGMKLLTRSKLLITSKKFRKRDDSPNLLARIVYTDGTKTEVRVPLERD